MFSAPRIRAVLVEPHSPPLRSEHYGLQHGNRLDKQWNQVRPSTGVSMSSHRHNSKDRESVIDSSCSYRLVPWQFQGWLCAAVRPISLSVYHCEGGLTYDVFVWQAEKWTSLGLGSDPRWLLGSAPDAKQAQAGTPPTDLGVDALWCFDHDFCREGTHGQCAILVSQLTLDSATCISWFAHKYW